MYKSKCGKEFKSSHQVGGHSTNCKECKIIRLVVLENKNKNCLICGKDLKNSQKKYCSQKCTATSGGRSMLGYKYSEIDKVKLYSNRNILEGKTFEEVYGKEKSDEIKLRISKGNKGKIISDAVRHKISNTEKGRKILWGDKISKSLIGKKLSEEHKRKLKENHVGMLGKNHNRETIRKMRIGYINRVKNRPGQSVPNYNPASIPILENKAKIIGITDLQHAENGGEYYIKGLGYYVDGYSKEKNVVLEYYEEFHKNQKEHDEQRKQEIVDFLKCDFIEIKE